MLMSRCPVFLTALATIAAAATPVQVDRSCRQGCRALVIRDGMVQFVDSRPPAPRSFVIGSYLAAAQSSVPTNEAPIRQIKAGDRWTILASAFLDHDSDNEGEPGVRIRFLDPNGRQQIADELSGLDVLETGPFFGGIDQVLVVTSEEEHAYNVQTEIWLLPMEGGPKRLLWFQGTVKGFVSSPAAPEPGVFISRQTYDGVHAETKGTATEFYAWDRARRSLILTPNRK
jgi:hypothetical protein